jgi:hypothetical protein
MATQTRTARSKWRKNIRALVRPNPHQQIVPILICVSRLQVVDCDKSSRVKMSPSHCEAVCDVYEWAARNIWAAPVVASFRAVYWQRFGGSLGSAP